METVAMAIQAPEPRANPELRGQDAAVVEYLERAPDRRIQTELSLAELRQKLGGPLPQEPADAQEVVEQGMC